MLKLSVILPLALLVACSEKPSTDRYGSVPTDTSLNERDRGGETATPDDQSNAQGDIDHLAEVRKAIVDDAQLSVSAKNVKILTQAGNVTLRGLVPTEEERARVEELARMSSATRSVDNQIEVESQ